MLERLKSRGTIISAVAFVAMVVLFVAHFQGMQKEDAVATHAVVPTRTPAPEVRPTPATADVEETDLATTIVPEAPKEVTYEEAEAAFLERRYHEAARLFTAYAERKSENPWGYYMLGLSAWKAGDAERAEAAFERSIVLDASHVKSYINLSRVLLDDGRPTEALVKIDDALDLDSVNGDAQRVRARALHELGNTTDAIAAYRRAIELDDRDAWSMNNLALILIEEGRYDEALPPLARAVEIRSDVAVFYNNLGMALECTGHFRDAVGAYSAAVDIDAAYGKATANLARAATVLEEPGLEPVDLAAAARRFTDEIASWSVTEVASERVQAATLPATATAVEADSTEGGE